MVILHDLLERNRRWAERMRARDPGFFARLAGQQTPKLLWIGCADSRVPANQVIDLDPGEVFVHRNVAGLVVHSDLNGLAVLQFAVEVLEVEHVIVCGHYGCGGVRAALADRQHGLIDNWLRHIRDVRAVHAAELEALADPEAQERRLCELNVGAQVHHVGQTPIVQNAWARGRPLGVHGWIYDVSDGLLRDLGVGLAGPADLDPVYRLAAHHAAQDKRFGGSGRD